MVKDGVTGFLVPPGDEIALAEKIRWFLSIQRRPMRWDTVPIPSLNGSFLPKPMLKATGRFLRSLRLS
jgi:hypothetical protein